MTNNAENTKNNVNDAKETLSTDLDKEKEGLYTTGANLLGEGEHTEDKGGCGCGCGHDHGEHAGHGEGCGCGHDHGDGRGEEAKDYTDPDVVREDGTNPAIHTVEEASGYNQNAEWNDGVRPEAGGDAEASGAADTDKDQIN